MRKRVVHTLAAVAVALVAQTVRAADHGDGTPGMLNAPDASSDITDVFAWMADATHVNLVMDVFPNAVTGSKFSNAVRYVFHTQAKASLLAATSTPGTVVCTFDAAQVISCWVLDKDKKVIDYVTGDASATTGLTSASGKIKVFAGLRDDPFFFNLAGFRNASQTIAGAIKAGVGAGNTITAIDAHGCPTLSSAGTTAIVGQLAGNAAKTGAGVDFFKKGTTGSADSPFSGNILSIVLTVDKSLISAAGSGTVGVWGSTNKAN